jgi:hypothetical protein
VWSSKVCACRLVQRIPPFVVRRNGLPANIGHTSHVAGLSVVRFDLLSTLLARSKHLNLKLLINILLIGVKITTSQPVAIKFVRICRCS